MSKPANGGVTERSPLLDNQQQEPQKDSPSDNDSPQDDVESPQPTEDTEDPDKVQGRKNVKSALPFLGVGIFLALLDQVIVAAINGEIGSELHSLKNVSWIATAYFLAMTASQPLYGKLSDVFGRKPCLLFAYTMFGIGSLGCGMSTSMAGLIAARAIQGIGGGGMLILVTVLLSDYIPLRDRGTYQGYMNLIGAIGTTSGGPVGGLFVQTIGWRWVFLIQVILCVIAIIALALWLRLPRRESQVSVRKQLPRIDFLGAILLVLATTGLLFGLENGSNFSWRSPLTIVSLCITIPLVLAFLAVETRFAVEPFTPGHVIFDKTLLACYNQNFFAYAAFTALLFYLPLLFQVKYDMSPPRAGASLIPSAISVTVGTVLGGIILKRTGKFYQLAVLAQSLATLGIVPLVVAPSLTRGSVALFYLSSVIGFLPQGVTITASLIAIISNVSAADQAVATACAFLFRSLGAAVGVSVIGVVIRSVLRMRLHAILEPREADRIVDGIARSLDYVKDLPPPVQATVRDCYSTGIQSGFALCVGLLAVATISVFWWREKKLSG